MEGGHQARLAWIVPVNCGCMAAYALWRRGGRGAIMMAGNANRSWRGVEIASQLAWNYSLHHGLHMVPVIENAGLILARKRIDLHLVGSFHWRPVLRFNPGNGSFGCQIFILPFGKLILNALFHIGNCHLWRYCVAHIAPFVTFPGIGHKLGMAAGALPLGKLPVMAAHTT